jgi:hypothetical protein
MHRSAWLVVGLAALAACGAPPAASPQPESPTGASPKKEAATSAPTDTSGGNETPGVEEVAVPEGKVRVQLFRRASVGQVQHVKVIMDEITDERHLRGKKLIANKGRRAHVEVQAKLKVLSVTSEGKQRDTQYTIERFVAQGPKGPEEVLPPGATLTVRRQIGRDGTAVTSTGPLSPEKLKAVDLVFSRRVSKTTDEQAFGTKEPKAAGESWPVNATLLSRDMKDLGIIFEPQAVRGSSTLLSVNSSDYEVVTRFEADPIDLAKMPAGTKVTEARIEAHVQATFPRDPAQPPQRTAMTMGMTIRAEVPDAKGSTTLVMGVKRERVSEVLP